MAEEWITVKCDDTDGTVARVTSRAFKTVYSKIGWSQVDEDEVVAVEERMANPVVTDTDDETKPKARGANKQGS